MVPFIMTDNIEEAGWSKTLSDAEKAEMRLSRLCQIHKARGWLEAFFDIGHDLPRVTGWRKARGDNRGRELRKTRR